MYTIYVRRRLAAVGVRFSWLDQRVKDCRRLLHRWFEIIAGVMLKVPHRHSVIKTPDNVLKITQKWNIFANNNVIIVDW